MTPKVFIVSAPSGAGKTTLIKDVLSHLEGSLERVVTCTTRAPRKGEIHGRDYWFLDEETFDRKVKEGRFLERAEVYGKKYGVLFESITEIKSRNKSAVLILDVQGALNVRRQMDVVLLFICPPSLEELKRRLEGRHTDSEEGIQRRLSKAQEEMEKRFFYDYIVVNDDFSFASDVIRSIIIAETHKNKDVEWNGIKPNPI